MPLSHLMAEAHQFKGTLISKNALQLWMLTGEYTVTPKELPNVPTLESAPFLIQRECGKIEERLIHKDYWIVKVNGYFYCVSDEVFERNFRSLQELKLL